MLVPCKPFQDSLVFGGKEEPTQVKHLLGAPFQGWLQALPTKNSLDWKGLSGAKHFSLLRELVTYGRKKFYNIGPRGLYYKTIQNWQIL